MEIKIRIEQNKPNITVSLNKPNIDIALKEVVTVYQNDFYEGEYTIIPSIEEQEMNTKDKLMKENVIIESIPYYETSNESGKTIYIGDKYE